MMLLRPAILLIIGFIAPSAWGAHSVDLRHASRELDHAADAFYQTLERRLGSGQLLADAEYFADGAYEFAVRVDNYENPGILWDDFQRLVDRFDYLARAFDRDTYASYQREVADDFYAVEIAMDRVGNAFRAMPRYRSTFNYSYSRWPWYQHRFWVHYHYAPPVRYYLPRIYVHNYYSSGARHSHIRRFKRRGHDHRHNHRPRHRDRHFSPNRGIAGYDRRHRGDRHRHGDRHIRGDRNRHDDRRVRGDDRRVRGDRHRQGDRVIRGDGNRRDDGNVRANRNNQNERVRNNDRSVRGDRNRGGTRDARNRNNERRIRNGGRADDAARAARNDPRRGNPGRTANDTRRAPAANPRAAAQPRIDRRTNQRNRNALAPPRSADARNNSRRQAATRSRPARQIARSQRPQAQRQNQSRPRQPVARRSQSSRPTRSAPPKRTSNHTVKSRSEPAPQRSKGTKRTQRRMERR